MNTSNIKKYAPQARNDFIAAMRKQAAKYGITAKAILPVEQKGDLLLIGDQVFPLSVMKPREKLIKRIQTSSFELTIDYIAYSWFNRLCAIRYMECKGLLDHGRRVLSSADGSAGLPQILEECLDIDLLGLDASRVAELKLDGNKDEELYRELLLAQCHALNQVMPLLFEQVSDESELLLPDNLTKTDSLIRDLVSSIPEEDWSDVQIIGWLYQFYISEKKDQVIGKVVKSEDIPAATQLFTPNWIVKYLVQNSVGRLWLMAQPDSTLASEWEYYIQPAEQTDEVNAQLKQLINVRISEDGDTLNPESITVLDPACGSGHILVEAYDCLKAIYLERGYRSRDIPRLILENNLYGIDIDTRAAQLASFALLMKAREDDRRLFSNPPRLNIIALRDSQPERLDALSQDLANTDIAQVDLKELLDLFEHASTFGSLIQIPAAFAKKLPDLESKLNTASESGDIFAQQSAQDLLPLVQQAKLLAKQYDAVIANPPYMGNKYLNPNLKTYLKKNYQGFEKDLFSAFMIRDLQLTKESGQLGFMSPFVWMFISSYENLRTHFIDNATISSLIQLEYSGFDGATVPICTFTLAKSHISDFVGSYIRLSDFRGSEKQAPKTLEAINNPECGWFFNAKPDEFKKIPGSPIAYWVSDKIREIFEACPSMGEVTDAVAGLQTGDNERFLRLWQEVNISTVGFGYSSREQAKGSLKKWFPHNKGGEFRKWYGNQEYLVNWKNDGEELYDLRPSAVIRNPKYYFKQCISWSDVTSSTNGFRTYDVGSIPNVVAPVVYEKTVNLNQILAFGNTNFASWLVKILNPTMHFHVGYFVLLPFANGVQFSDQAVANLISIAKNDWNAYETSWDFTQNPIIRTQQSNLEQAFNAWQQQNADAVAEMKRLEEENNKLFIDAYGLQDELTPDVPDAQITLTRADREKDSQRLVSYALGCMMGRYSLDEPGLIYAHAGNQDFDASRYQTFPADADGIIPLTEMHWFEDDATHRIREFLTAVWGKDTLDANMQWLAESLDKKANETAEDTIRRYLASKFYKDHMQTYKKRPIYWLFSSGKQGAFQALVYLHRYNESTLARMRTEYVMPLISKMSAMANSLESEIENSDSAAEIKRKEKELQNLHKQQAELSSFEEKLRHYADQRISLDLDDGVKVNYGKFGDLLAEVKAVTGEK
ncbi:BREX-1 system adenine-specific DNA-methyltransferase PglX [Acinetobacter baumannii]|uniref:BREX-1 system adenine-specific DNA-methyltransferase PglX n=1 Tax=Acinetobacter calcoaceticus/baumannii complex TaxID=909768 RepID=UPI000FBCCBD2|nr:MULTISPECIES: BREX-1 system adenine-specific DNA-methyltransferase PglX [Acinetobacter calcoaceticus/baumannii complex]MCG5776561.1 BREX-1 system adenine-specific DNA-methyltransferase PglX [Acinetobacter baumannii]MCG5784373.1 BREX-1 system adenine-specific DNA-methyltransferase PglX [Acinetobacter baumannii]MCZ3065040.1 BREX-1 system adenine-specific DNA-methyltransferase PglX [Acinetobacter baumannii]MDC5426842.1 BREX-1 system adenine-specific DNA-methyltransferase PglX [Acinetobacter bau